MDERGTGGVGGARRSEGAHRRRARRRHRRLESRRDLRRRSGAAAAAAQADAVCRTAALRQRAHDVRARRTRVAQTQAYARLRRTTDMSAAFTDLVDLASERLGAAVVAANDEFFAPKEG